MLPIGLEDLARRWPGRRSSPGPPARRPGGRCRASGRPASAGPARRPGCGPRRGPGGTGAAWPGRPCSSARTSQGLGDRLGLALAEAEGDRLAAEPGQGLGQLVGQPGQRPARVGRLEPGHQPLDVRPAPGPAPAAGRSVSRSLPRPGRGEPPHQPLGDRRLARSAGPRTPGRGTGRAPPRGRSPAFASIAHQSRSGMWMSPASSSWPSRPRDDRQALVRRQPPRRAGELAADLDVGLDLRPRRPAARPRPARPGPGRRAAGPSRAGRRGRRGRASSSAVGSSSPPTRFSAQSDSRAVWPGSSRTIALQHRARSTRPCGRRSAGGPSGGSTGWGRPAARPARSVDALRQVERRGAAPLRGLEPVDPAVGPGRSGPRGCGSG